MSKKSIQLGDEIKDITSGSTGICIGEERHLSGAEYWILQPPTTDDNVSIKQEYVPKAYCQRIGDGVRIKPKPQVGFRAGKD